jgi:2-(3-amino-3-carboxypropyl)histidine synthase
MLESSSSSSSIVSISAPVGVGSRASSLVALGDDAHDVRLDEAIAALPAHYNFELKKTVSKIRASGAKRVALQFPEGLLIFACTIADIVGSFTGADTVILGDVTFGACCVDDLGAAALSCDFLVHYGHSCLVPVGDMARGVRVLYVFVDISFDIKHLCESIRSNFPCSARLVLAGTIQFAGALGAIREALSKDYPALSVPQARPLSPGEVLGCTAPVLTDAADALIFVADGRFHLEALMIRNPSVAAYRYDPYAKVLSRERYDTAGMLGERQDAIHRATRAAAAGATWGIVLGTLGRQGSPKVLDTLLASLARRGIATFTVLLAEISPAKLAAFGDGVGAWVQIACPRLSIDWGAEFKNVPLLTPYEAYVAIQETPWQDVYPMDYYQRGSGPWTNYHTPRAQS